MAKVRNIASCPDCKKLVQAAMAAYDKNPNVVTKSICDYHMAAIKAGVTETAKRMR
jgi:hypothetical protein